MTNFHIRKRSSHWERCSNNY
ncbi:hypothetical protein Gohar_013438 [Gossypium harknessii]|uniref:Uncharacterized protein n=1 Tax=Gossypium harknessii TaxID=34285 RepID=A0A7J9H0T4_9ROSI|nr:hypothetical protein [Gossypium harknessii]